MKPHPKFKKFLFFLLIAPFAVFIFGYIIMWLWNTVLVPVLVVKTINFWQALGILILSKILFGNFSSSKNSHGWRKQKHIWESLNEEEKESFKAKWKEKWGKFND